MWKLTIIRLSLSGLLDWPCQLTVQTQTCIREGREGLLFLPLGTYCVEWSNQMLFQGILCFGRECETGIPAQQQWIFIVIGCTAKGPLLKRHTSLWPASNPASSTLVYYILGLSHFVFTGGEVVWIGRPSLTNTWDVNGKDGLANVVISSLHSRDHCKVYQYEVSTNMAQTHWTP